MAWIREHGPLWKSELCNLWNDAKVSLRQIAQQLKVDPLTVKRHAAKLKLLFPRNGKRISGRIGPPKVATKNKYDESKLIQRKTAWIDLRTQNSSKNTKTLRLMAPACYAYLYRHCREWRRAHCPLPNRFKPIVYRVDWHARDLNLAEKVDLARKTLLHEPGQPKRISIATLGRQLGALALVQKHLSKLPLTQKALLAAEESQLDFSHRRTNWAKWV